MTRVARETDIETGAWKEAPFEEALWRAVSNARKSDESLSLMYVDLDNATEHGDLHGQDALAQAIALTARALSDVADGRGPIGRVGPNAFATFLVGIDRDAAVKLAERVREVALFRVFISESGWYRLTVSIGVATLRRRELPGNLLDAAQEACIRAKQGGRDQVAVR